MQDAQNLDAGGKAETEILRQVLTKEVREAGPVLAVCSGAGELVALTTWRCLQWVSAHLVCLLRHFLIKQHC